MAQLKIKVCGMRDAGNIRRIAELRPDFMGFVFYRGSPRFAGGVLTPEDLRPVGEDIVRVGVFVDEQPEQLLYVADRFNLTALQLHGGESPAYCAALRRRLSGCLIFKAFGVDAAFDFARTGDYHGAADMFVFDAKSEQRGGSGRHFDWKLLRSYGGDTSFLIGGGIAVEDVPALVELAAAQPKMCGIDVNSRIETEAGIKSPELTRRFIEAVRE